MGPKRLKTTDPVEGDEGSVGGSVGSRSSARLKRKRESGHHLTGKALQFDALREEGGGGDEEQEKRRMSKRIKKHHVEPFFVGDSNAKPLFLADVEMTVLEEDVEMEESKMEVLVTVAASEMVVAPAAAVATAVAKVAPPVTAALDLPLVAPEPRAVVPSPPKPSSAVAKPLPVRTPGVKAVHETPRVEVTLVATEAPVEVDRASDVARPPSALMWRALGLDRTLGWLVVLLLLQLLLFPLWKQTIWTGTMALSNVLVAVYRWTESTGPHVPNPQLEIQQAMQTLDQLQVELQTLQQQEEVGLKQWQEMMQSADSDDDDRNARLASLTVVVQQLQESNGEEFDDGLARIVEPSEDQRGPKLLNLAPFHRLVSKLLQQEHRLPGPPEGACGDAEDAFVGNASDIDPVRFKLSEQIKAWQRNDTTHPLHQRARSWIQRQIQQQVHRFQKVLDAQEKGHINPTTSGKEKNALLQGLRRVIEQRFSLEAAGGDGRIDYAAMGHGGRVVSASLSLVDDLPLLNRLAAFWKLRFYGHGPSVALTPSGGALGHCWSLVGDSGQLTVQLGRAIQVQSVVIEHVAAAAQVVAPSAPRAFRVFGYESANATVVTGDPDSSALGTFEFDYSKAKGGHMEFPVRKTAVQFVRLQIDSNWGNPDNYTCLYRFRVHGQPLS
jgi:Sad1 / UNC-like C-terminal